MVLAATGLMHAPPPLPAHQHDWQTVDRWVDSGGGTWVEQKCVARPRRDEHECGQLRRRRPGR